jgi:hypothetical protein
MRAAAMALLALVALSACRREPSFDERYTGAEKAIRDKASELDKDMAGRASQAAGDPTEAAVPST